MNKRDPVLRIGIVTLLLALVWRMLGAPLTAEQWRSLDVPLWQARVLLPGRMERIWSMWCGSLNVQELSDGSQQAARPDEEVTLLGAQARQPVMLQVWNDQTGQLESMELERYVYGVVAAEMPAAYHTEALKAQAVAARTRALYQQAGEGCALAAGADVCTRSGHCQGFAGEESLAQKWGNEYALYQQRVVEAVSGTAGQIVTWEGKPILVMYHAISGGRTENVQAVFAQPLPYLVSVESGGEEGVRGYREDAFYSFEEAAGLLAAAFPELSITPQELQRTLTVAAHTATGRVDSLLLCGGEVKATDFRAALGLRSTLFTLTMDQNGITFHQTGYGHGVGMSQAGANRMAAEGAGYQAILSHYYPGTSLERR